MANCDSVNLFKSLGSENRVIVGFITERDNVLISIRCFY